MFCFTFSIIGTHVLFCFCVCQACSLCSHSFFLADFLFSSLTSWLGSRSLTSGSSVRLAGMISSSRSLLSCQENQNVCQPESKLQIFWSQFGFCFFNEAVNHNPIIVEIKSLKHCKIVKKNKLCKNAQISTKNTKLKHVHFRHFRENWCRFTLLINY